MTEKLNEYNEKRNFEKTKEPEGMSEASEEGLRFVVQHHMARKEHYDLRLEWEGVMLSWAVPKGPSFDTHDKRLAVQVEDHPLEYRNFEGTIPKGEYGGGIVMIWDEGFWEPFGNVREGLKKGELKFALMGARLKGKWALVRWKAISGDTKDNWLLLKEKDEYVQASSPITEFMTSIRTGRTMEEIEGGEREKVIRNPFQSLEVMLAKLVQEIPEGDGWLYEMKYDGYRIIAFVEGNHARLITRNGNDYSHRFKEVTNSLIHLAKGRAMVLDGEVAVTDATGKTDFQALQNYMKNPNGQKLVYIVFDILSLDGVDLREQPLIERKSVLEELMKGTSGNLYYGRYVRGNGKECFQAAQEADMEGIVGKKETSVYSGTRNGDWIKLKCDKRQEFVIGGYTLTDKKTNGISALLLGTYENRELIYAGRTGTGLSEREMKNQEEKFINLIRQQSPFLIAPKARNSERITWLEPELVAEVKFAEWTKDNHLRQASFKGLRTDKNPREVKREAVDQLSYTEVVPNEEQPARNSSGILIIEGIKITNPDKVLFENPPITKEDIIRYYLQVGERMLEYSSNRILSVVRCPKGVSQPCFFKKHPLPGTKGIITIPIAGNDKIEEEYFYIKDIQGLIAEVQLGTLEFHTWGSRVDSLEQPDVMVFDLDPDEGMELERIRQGAREIKDLLSELSLKSYLKTSGGKGYHVVVPFQPSADWAVFHDFARRIAEVMEKKWPDRYTSNVRKARRSDRIFIDWIRNGRGATSIAPYSIRARKGGKVSMPIRWEELDETAPDSITMEEAIRRIRLEDPWKGFYQNDQRIRV